MKWYVFTVPQRLRKIGNDPKRCVFVVYVTFNHRDLTGCPFRTDKRKRREEMLSRLATANLPTWLDSPHTPHIHKFLESKRWWTTETWQSATLPCAVSYVTGKVVR